MVTKDNFKPEDMIIKYKRKFFVRLSFAFLTSRDCWENLASIKKLFQKKAKLFDEMQNKPKYSLRHYDKLLTELEFEIQKAYKFEPDVHFHRFWERPLCKCPDLDNEERWGTGSYIVMGDCPLHGHHTEADKERILIG